ncbi:heterokaryon incompatibility protein-domain-containing protein [Xylaria digitata]|nr:heterokaryon incompatibility protein-domain-containing protein [Xylaria digitata]
MWLIETSTLKLEFFTEAKKGSYAILSHTWEEEEVSIEQLRNLSQAWLENAQHRKRLIKIIKTCEVASQHGLSYAWVDTCCIDKSSSAELLEAINSMFRYYRDAAFCISFISDLSDSSYASDLNAHFESQFPHCRWLTRGWTLQELIAPPELFFNDSTWSLRGSKNDWKPLLSKETGVDEAILGSLDGLRHVPVARRMSWVSKRQTTRIEDMAYCLLGIFDVNMPLIYGEGQKAFVRLQEEIAKESCDLSLFAWQQLDLSQNYRGILARSPAEFSNCRGIKHQIKNAVVPTEFTLTNRGLRIETALVKVPAASEHLILNIGFSFRDDWHTRTSRGWIGIYLAKTQNGFVRAKPDTLFQALSEGRLRCPLALIHVRKMVDSLESLEVDQRFERAIRVEVTQFPAYPRIIAVEAFSPEGLWVEQRASFMHQGQGINAYIRCGVRLPDNTLRPIIVACSTMDVPVCAIWHYFDPLWGNIEQFLSNANERADFIAADYLRFHFLSQESHSFSSSAIKHLQSQNMEKLVSVSAELEERTAEGGQSMFILHIKAWVHLEADGRDI